MFTTPLDAAKATHLRELLDQIRLQQIEGRVEQALQLAYRQLEAYLEVDIYIQLLSQWNQAERDRLQNLITQDEFTVQRSKVSTLLGQLLDEVEEALTATGFHAEVETPGAAAGDPSPPIFTDKQQLLVLYAEGDRAIWRALDKHFFLLRKMPAFHWSDLLQDRPKGLQDEYRYYEQWVDAADKVLCLVSPNILAYPSYPLAERAAQAQKLIPLKMITVDLEGTVFAPLGSLPSDNRFASQWPDTNAAYVDIAQQLRRYLQKLAQT
jgi:hypothetical protein